MVEGQCRDDAGGDAPKIRFLKFLLAGVLHARASGTRVTRWERHSRAGTRLNLRKEFTTARSGRRRDVDAALCPFCPALETPGIDYLRPPTNPSEHRKQEFIEHCHRFHNFNG